MSLLKSQKNAAVESPVGLTAEQQKEFNEFNKKVQEVNEFMRKNNLAFVVQHQVVIVPKHKSNV